MNYLERFVLLTAIVTLLACHRTNNKADASGVFEATAVVVSAQAAGPVVAFHLDEGTLLEAGQVVGYIDTIPLYLKQLQLEANIKAIESRKTDISKQMAAIIEQIATQKRELERFTNLVNANAANQKQVDDINASIVVLEKQLVAQTELLQNSNQSISHERLALEVQVAQIKDQIDKSLIISPISGTVLSKYTEQGEFAAPGKALFKVADMERFYLRAYITSDILSQIKLGQEVGVTADFGESGSRNYKGLINWISSEAEFTPKNIQTRSERDNLVYAVKITVQNDGYLKIGMYGEVRFLP